MYLAERQLAGGVHADQEQVGIFGMKRDEVADIGLETADFFPARIERMDQADIVTRVPGGMCVTRALCKRDGRDHAVFLIRAFRICGILRIASLGITAAQRA